MQYSIKIDKLLIIVTYLVMVLSPKMDPNIVAKASTQNACVAPGKLPSSSMTPILFAMPSKVPI